MDKQGTARFTITRNSIADAVVLGISGEIDVSTSRGADAGLRTASEPRPQPALVVVDLTTVGFFSAAGVHLLAGFGRSCENRGLRHHIVATTGTIARKVVLITGLNEEFPTFSSVDEALHAA
ncbi:STAS domain-containing protein [Amycolatopsis sp. OK19-0408]|uniref:STAS domain-containing protein n=1 Tax=Amycolatopsis iheyensis TaxID=2945988 RepID=A0A9X2NHP9_9PSEU|nr:STAS domain-containing protein [Amycolatopsis iheyensis]MCR6488986.1 STAS domain-containing protein [Amycolatopsis iheyensis]